MKPIYLIFHLLLCLSHSMMSQNKETDTLYIKYDKNFNIRESLVAENRDVLVFLVKKTLKRQHIILL
jgi:hypothetical protein